MGCGCNKRSTSGRRFNTLQEPVRVVSAQGTRSSNFANAQMQAQALGINNTPAAMNAEKRKLEKLRREAIKRSLNR